MARYNYDATKVNYTLEELSDAYEMLANTATELTKGINIIKNARGIEYIQIDANTILEYPETTKAGIEAMMTIIRNKAQEIEEYNSSSWWEKGLSTAGMFFTKVGEGFATAGEQLVDGFASATGMVVGIFSSDTKENIGEWVKKDHVGDFFYDQYETGALKEINKYSIVSHESTAANVFKNVGVATGYIAAAATTGGLGNLTKGGSLLTGAKLGTDSIAIDAALTGIGGVGSITQESLKDGLSYNDAFTKGLMQGTLNAGITVGAGMLAKKIFSPAKTSNTGLSTIDDISDLMSTSSEDIVTNIASQTDEFVIQGSKIGKDGSKYYVIKYKDGTSDLVEAATGRSAVLGKKTLTNNANDIFTSKINKNADNNLLLPTNQKSFDNLTSQEVFGKDVFTRKINKLIKDENEITSLPTHLTNSADDASKIFNSNNKRNFLDVKTDLETNLGIKVEKIGTETIGNTSIPLNSKITINNTEYNVYSTLKTGKVNGALKHVYEGIEQTTETVRKVNLDEVQKILEKSGMQSRMKQITETSSESQIKRAITTALKKQNITDAQTVTKTIDSCYDSGKEIFTSKCQLKFKDNLERAGMSDIYDDMIRNGIDNYSVQELREINGQALYKTYISAIKKYDMKEFAHDLPGKYVGRKIEGIPAPIEVGINDKTYEIGVITRRASQSESGQVTVFHMLHDSKTPSKTIALSAEEQGVKLANDYINLKNPNITKIFNSNSKILPDTMQDFENLTEPARKEILNKLTTEIKLEQGQKYYSGSNKIEDIELYDTAMSGAKDFYKSDVFEKKLMDIIKKFYQAK